MHNVQLSSCTRTYRWRRGDWRAIFNAWNYGPWLLKNAETATDCAHKIHFNEQLNRSHTHTLVSMYVHLNADIAPGRAGTMPITNVDSMRRIEIFALIVYIDNSETLNSELVPTKKSVGKRDKNSTGCSEMSKVAALTLAHHMVLAIMAFVLQLSDELFLWSHVWG